MTKVDYDLLSPTEDNETQDDFGSTGERRCGSGYIVRSDDNLGTEPWHI